MNRKYLLTTTNVWDMHCHRCKHQRWIVIIFINYKRNEPFSMKSVLDASTREELIRRIDSLNESSVAQWGKMNVYQMLKHCSRWDEMVHNNKMGKRVFIGRIIGAMALRSVLKDDKPLGKNEPTLPELVIKENGDVADEKAKWILRIKQYEHYSHNYFVHPFFGKMTREQIGRFAYKHTDHHLRQFNS